MKHYINEKTGEIFGYKEKDCREMTDEEMISLEESLNKPELSLTAKATRDNAINSGITVHDAVWQVTDNASDIRSIIYEAEIIGASDDEATQFRLSDNSWRETTLAELKAVLTAFVARKREIWAQFAAWDAGDKSSAFEFTENSEAE